MRLVWDDHPGVLFLDEQRAPPREVALATQHVERYVDTGERHDETFHVPDGWV
jgi:hypothetical protein